MIPPEEIRADSSGQIYSRLLSAVTDAKLRRDILGKHAAEVRPSLYLGEEEWKAIGELLKKWGVEWSGSGEKYDPAEIEDNRAEFKGVKIYRVDATQHLTAV